MASVGNSVLTLPGSFPTWSLFVLSFAPDSTDYNLYLGTVYSSWVSVNLRDDLDFTSNQLFIGTTHADDVFAANTDVIIDDLLMWNYELTSSDVTKLVNSYA